MCESVFWVYASPVPRRWGPLAACSLAVLVADQGTKLLVVERLTPAVARAAFDRPPWSEPDPASGRPVAPTGRARRQALAELGIGRKLVWFYAGVLDRPCAPAAARCPPERLAPGLALRYVENEGLIGGLGGRADETWRGPALMALGLAGLAVLLGLGARLPPRPRNLGGLGLVLGGALGNLLDRGRLGYVIDFVDLHLSLGGRSLHWPTFNLADLAITAGAALLLAETRPWRAEARTPTWS